MKILYVTTVASTMDFFAEHFKMLQEENHTVEIACNCRRPVSAQISALGVKVHDIPFSRSPFSKENLTAAKTLKSLLLQGKYDVVHTHTPNASAIVRLVCRKLRKNGLRVFYTAHGFHFYKGAPLKNWLVYYPVEWLCAHWTDALITINKEDYALAQKHMHAKNVVYIPGVGINLEQFGVIATSRSEKRKELGIPEDAILLLSVGELNDNKNHESVIKAIGDKNVYYVIAGIGEKKDYLQNLASKVGLADRVQLLGFRKDVGDLLATADAFVFPSFREGLSVSLMEAMASGVPCVVSKIRGNVDLVDEHGGVLFAPDSVEDCRLAIEKMLTADRQIMGSYNRKKVVGFGEETVIEKLKGIYGIKGSNKCVN